MSVILYGVCGCCGILTAENQVVWSMVPYPLGNVRMVTPDEVAAWGQVADGNFILYPSISSLGYVFTEGTVYTGTNSIPTTCYLGYRETYTAPGGTVVYDILSNAYDGSSTVISPPPDSPGLGELLSEIGFEAYGWDPAPPIQNTLTFGYNSITQSFASGCTVKYEIYGPYTLDQAVKNAVGLLGNVGLLNPIQQYIDYTGTPYYFCYGTQDAYYGYNLPGGANASNVVVIRQDANGVPQLEFDTNNFRGIASLAFACNGISYSVGGVAGAGFAFDGWLYAAKCATRYSMSFTLRTDLLFNSILGTYQYHAPVAVNILPGESIFDPSDVPGYGQSEWG